MKNFDLELRVNPQGQILSFETYLNDTNPTSLVINHNSPYDNEKNCYARIFTSYSAPNDRLVVIVTCDGVIGAETACKVLINGVEQAHKVVKKIIEPGYASHTYYI